MPGAADGRARPGRADPVAGRGRFRIPRRGRARPGDRPGCSDATRACGRSASGRRTRRPPGPSSASASASGRPPRSRPRMPAQLGEPVSFGDHVVHAFPAPQRLADSGRVRRAARPQAGMAPLGRHRRARTAASTRPGSAALPPERGPRRAQELPGIGTFAAELVLLRGAGRPGPHPPATRPGWPAPSPSPTACREPPSARTSNASARTGGPTAPGSRCCCAPTSRTRLTRSPARPPGNQKLAPG